MNDSQLLRFAVPAAVTDGRQTQQAVPVLAQAVQAPLRVLVRNTSFGNAVWVAHSVQELQRFPVGPNTFELPPGTSEVFVLAPGQKLFCVADGQGATVNVAQSELIPERLDFRS